MTQPNDEITEVRQATRELFEFERWVDLGFNRLVGILAVVLFLAFVGFRVVAESSLLVVVLFATLSGLALVFTVGDTRTRRLRGKTVVLWLTWAGAVGYVLFQ